MNRYYCIMNICYFSMNCYNEKAEGILMGSYNDDQFQKYVISQNLLRLLTTVPKDQKQIAIELDVNPPTFNQWVNGKAIPSVSMLKRLAAYFKVPLTSIVDPLTMQTRDVILTAEETDMIVKYRNASQSIKDAVVILLNYKEV